MIHSGAYNELSISLPHLKCRTFGINIVCHQCRLIYAASTLMEIACLLLQLQYSIWYSTVYHVPYVNWYYFFYNDTC